MHWMLILTSTLPRYEYLQMPSPKLDRLTLQKAETLHILASETYHMKHDMVNCLWLISVKILWLTYSEFDYIVCSLF